MNTYTLEIIPKPDTPNRNGCIYSKESLDAAIEKYNETIAAKRAMIV